MKKKKNDNDIVVSTLGKSTNDVTGSCWSISYPKKDGERGLIIIECGLSQDGNTVEEMYSSNKKMLENIGKDIVDKCEFLLISHSHADHIGNLPYFNEDNGFKGKILGTKKTIEISKELIKDSVYIHQKNVEYMKSKGKRTKPLYTELQMYSMFNHMENVELNDLIKLNEYVSVKFRPNSHVIGSSNITIVITKPNNQKKIITYTGDLGSKYNFKVSNYLDEQEVNLKCNLFISEATYNDKERQINYDLALKEREEIKTNIKKFLLEGRRILFPTFAFARSQQLLTYFYEWFKDEDWFDFPVVIDGVLVNNINSIYCKILDCDDKDLFEKALNWNCVKMNKDYKSTLATLSRRTAGIYITSSGFLQNGRITTYLPQFIETSKDVIIMTGYCGGEGSIGMELLNQEKNTFTIDKRTYQKKCSIFTYKTFSSHMSYNELLELWSKVNCDKILIHHSGNKKYDMIEEAKEYLKSKNKTTPIVPCNDGACQFIL